MQKLELKMIKLTPIQYTALIAASTREDGIATRPDGLKAAGVAKVAAKLIEQGLAREILARAGMPIWHEDEQGRPLSLKILKAGRSAVSVARAADESDGAAMKAPLNTDQIVAPSSSRTGGGSKRDLVLAMMQRQQGATIGDLMSATGWLPHTTRAALSGLRKKGISIVRSRGPNGQSSVYKVGAQVLAA